MRLDVGILCYFHYSTSALESKVMNGILKGFLPSENLALILSPHQSLRRDRPHTLSSGIIHHQCIDVPLDTSSKQSLNHEFCDLQGHQICFTRRHYTNKVSRIDTHPAALAIHCSKAIIQQNKGTVLSSKVAQLDRCQD